MRSSHALESFQNTQRTVLTIKQKVDIKCETGLEKSAFSLAKPRFRYKTSKSLEIVPIDQHKSVASVKVLDPIERNYHEIMFVCMWKILPLFRFVHASQSHARHLRTGCTTKEIGIKRILCAKNKPKPIPLSTFRRVRKSK